MGLFSMNEMTTYRWSFEEDVDHYAAAGIPGISIWRPKLADFGEEKGIVLLAERGLRVASLGWAGGFTGSDGRTYKEALADAHEAIRLAAELHAGCLIIYSGARGGHTNNHARRLFKSALTDLGPIAAEFGVTLAIEPMHAGCAAEWTFLTDLDEAIVLLDEVDNDALKLVFDTYHFGFDPVVLDHLSQLARRIAIVQLGDARQPPNGEPNRCRLGDGEIPFKQIITTLENAGYEGGYDVELMGEEMEAYTYDDLLAHSKEVFETWQSCLHRP